MILTVAASLSALGFVTWILGASFDYPGIAVIGGTIVVGVGALITGGGLEVQNGEVEFENTDGELVTENTYEEIDTGTNLPLGVLVILLGGTLVLRSLDEAGEG